MSATIEEITKEALQLSPRERLALAGFLLEIGDTSGDPDADEAWEQEIRSRIKAIGSGSIVGIPCRDVMREADNRLAT